MTAQELERLSHKAFFCCIASKCEAPGIVCPLHLIDPAKWGRISSLQIRMLTLRTWLEDFTEGKEDNLANRVVRHHLDRVVEALRFAETLSGSKRCLVCDHPLRRLFWCLEHNLLEVQNALRRQITGPLARRSADQLIELDVQLYVALDRVGNYASALAQGPEQPPLSPRLLDLTSSSPPQET